MNTCELQSAFGYTFNDKSILEHALTHKSATGNEGSKSNERLEFLGDAVLQLAISTYLFNKYEKMPEGKMAKLRASLVCQPTLADLASQLNLANYIKLGKGEMLSNGNHKPSILSDAFEAVLGAMYIDGGYAKAQEAILKIFVPVVPLYLDGIVDYDHKTKLQEILQKDGNVKIKYKVVKESGMPHDMSFVVDVTCNDKVIGTGMGKSKKSAEQDAAKCAIDKMNVGKEK